MIDVQLTDTFKTWWLDLKDKRAVDSIARRLRRFELGNFGDWKAVGGSVREMRVDVGAGYRCYYIVKGETVVILLYGGDKRT
jgi:putative addiction module killer protein